MDASKEIEHVFVEIVQEKEKFITCKAKAKEIHLNSIKVEIAPWFVAVA